MNEMHFCRHNPLKLNNGFLRFFKFVVRRKENLSDFTCELCGQKLVVPWLYSSCLLKIAVYLTAYFAVEWYGSEMFERKLQSNFAVIGIPLGFYLMYRIATAAILAFGNWKPVDDDTPTNVLSRSFTQATAGIAGAGMIGSVLAVLDIRNWNVAFYILAISIVWIIASIIDKKWYMLSLAILVTVYSIVSLLIVADYRTVLDLTDQIAIHISVFFVFLLDNSVKYKKKA